MKFFDTLFRNKTVEYNDDDIVAVCDGEIIPNSDISDEMFSKELMGKTIAIKPESSEIVSPANGEIELIFPTGHAFGIRTKDGTGILVHIGINTVDLNGKCFKKFKKRRLCSSRGKSY